MAAGKKRVLDDAASPKAKKTKTEDHAKKSKEKAVRPPEAASALVSDDIDFPRGGGTSLTPLEVKTLRAEAAKEADKELFDVSSSLRVCSSNRCHIFHYRKVLRSPRNTVASLKLLSRPELQRRKVVSG